MTIYFSPFAKVNKSVPFFQEKLHAFVEKMKMLQENSKVMYGYFLSLNNMM